MISFLGSDALAQDGEQLFKQNCMACHKMGTRLVGPDLTGVTERRSEDWIRSFISNSQAMVKAGDADAVAIFKEFNNVPMTSFPMSDAELTALVGYLARFGAAEEAAAQFTANAKFLCCQFFHTLCSTLIFYSLEFRL